MTKPTQGPTQSPTDWFRGVQGRLRPRAKLPPEVLLAQIKISYGHLPLALLVNGVVSITLGWSFMTPASRGPELLWIAGCLLLGALRYADTRTQRALTLDPQRLSRARRHLKLGAGLQGILWGIAGTALLPASPMLQLFLISVISGMTAGAIILLAPIWSAYVLFAIPTIFPLCIRLLGGGLVTQKLTGGLGLVYSCAMLFMAARTSRWLEDSLIATQENGILAGNLQSANQALQVYHADLEAAVWDRTLELREINLRLQLEMATNEQARLKAEEREEALRRTQKLESLGILAGGIAHDFNNLLAAILGNLNLLQLETPPGAKGQVFMDHMEVAVTRAKNLTQQMLAYSGKGHFVIQSLDLNQVVRELTSLLEVCISKRARFRLDLAPGPCFICGDQTQLQQVVMNLVTNASEALGDGDGEIQVSTRALELDAAAAAHVSRVVPTFPGPHVLLEVRDTGQGMSPEVLTRIFDPFFTTKESGRGLGLSAMLGILQGHNAGIEIHSLPLSGSTFRIYFPTSSVIPQPAEASAELRSGLFRGQVLVVDDEPAILETAEAMLKDLGLDVVTARNGLEAMAFMGQHGSGIDLVLLDLTMPHMDGRQTLRALRRLCPTLPVILSSGYDPRQTPAGLRDLEAPAFLQKPYTLQELRRVLTVALGPDPVLVN